MALNLKVLSTRAISAFFFVLILMGCIWYSYLTFFLLFFVVSLIALHEYYKLATRLGAEPNKGLGFLTAIVLFLYFAVPYISWQLQVSAELLHSSIAALLILFPFALLIKALLNPEPNNLLSMMHSFLGVVYAVVPFGLLLTIPLGFNEHVFEYNYFKVLGILFLIWSNDTLAYLGGSLFGQHKMYERISPGKTWEGTLIGVAGAIGVGFVLNLNHTYDSIFIWPAIAFLVAVFGTLGDLVESMLKRQARVKDSGQLMPGHGGALDRFDSLIFVSPFVYAFLKLVGQNWIYLEI